MNEKIPVFHNGKIVNLSKPIVSKARARIMELPVEEQSTKGAKYLFVDMWTGYHTLATLYDVTTCEEELEETYEKEGYAAWCDLWAGINNDFIPSMSVAGGEERALILSKGYPTMGCACALGWSQEYERQFNDPEGFEAEQLHFENIWDEERKLYWIASNLVPVIGFNQY